MTEPIVALIGHGSEVNLMSTEVYRRKCWPVTTDHGWRIRLATRESEEFTVACPEVKVTIRDISIFQHFFVQDDMSFPIILGEPYIVVARMETKVLDNGSAYAQIKSPDGVKTMQFMTVLSQGHGSPGESKSLVCNKHCPEVIKLHVSYSGASCISSLYFDQV